VGVGAVAALSRKLLALYYTQQVPQSCTLKPFLVAKTEVVPPWFSCVGRQIAQTKESEKRRVSAKWSLYRDSCPTERAINHWAAK
jgi:hypothetical protein